LTVPVITVNLQGVTTCQPDKSDGWAVGMVGRLSCKVANQWTMFCSCQCSIVLHHSVYICLSLTKVVTQCYYFYYLFIVPIIGGKLLKPRSFENMKYYAPQPFSQSF